MQEFSSRSRAQTSLAQIDMPNAIDELEKANLQRRETNAKIPIWQCFARGTWQPHDTRSFCPQKLKLLITWWQTGCWPVSLAHVVVYKRPHLKQSGRREVTAEVSDLHTHAVVCTWTALSTHTTQRTDMLWTKMSIFSLDYTVISSSMLEIPQKIVSTFYLFLNTLKVGYSTF